MWNKPQQESDAIPTPQPEPAPSNPSPAAKPDRQAVLGPSITIKGSLSGEEDLLIEGHVEGEISFKKHAVTVGKRGRVGWVSAARHRQDRPGVNCFFDAVS